jgi:hypothetical protein
MSVCDPERLMVEWEKCAQTRYPVLVVVPSTPDKISPFVINEFAKFAQSGIFDFEERYKGELGRFVSRADVRAEILDRARYQTVVVLNVEHFYDKWTNKERLEFLRDTLRQDGHRGIILLLYCDEDFSVIGKEISQNNRGIIYNP